MPAWEEHSYTRRDENGNLISFEEYQRTHKPTGLGRIMTFADLKLYSICGIGFFLDAYDLFIINLVNPMITFEYWGGLAVNHGKQKKPLYPPLLKGAVNAGANIGNVIGQLSFGFLGDAFGRKFVYGKELIVAMVGIIMVISLPNKGFDSVGKMWWLFGFRILLGIGIGGDYPMSAAIVAERSTVRNRGKMLAWIFSNQGWGTLAASVVTLVLLGCFKGSLEGANGNYGKLDGLWRTQIGLALVPACALLYFRLTMPEGRKYLQSNELNSVNSSLASSNVTLTEKGYMSKEAYATAKDVDHSPDEEVRRKSVEDHAMNPVKTPQFRAFVDYFSEWRHLKVLIGTASTWFLVDVAFYGTNLNQSQLLTEIGYAKGANEYDTLVKTATGNLIIAAAGYVPGYFFTIAFVEIIGRKYIQLVGFLITSLAFGIIAGDYGSLGTGGKFACFTIAQFFFNFGPNATTFIIPGEVFPSRVRGFAHGISAATGKLGAILAGVLFNYLSDPTRIGIANVLWIFFACGIMGAIMTWFFVPETKGMDADDIDYKECQELAARRSGQ